MAKSSKKKVKKTVQQTPKAKPTKPDGAANDPASNRGPRDANKVKTTGPGINAPSARAPRRAH